MKREKGCGFTLVEVLVALAVAAVAGVALSGLLEGSRRAFALQRERTELAQNAMVAMTLLQHDIRTAGSPGNLQTSSGAGRGEALIAASAWPFAPTPTLNTLLVLPSGASCGATVGCDALTITRVIGVGSLMAGFSYRLEQVTYTAKRDRNGLFNLYRLVRHYNCLAVQAGRSACTDDAGNSRTTPQPAVEGVEEFQVFFLSTDGRTALTPFPGGTRTNTTAAVAVYLRLRASRPNAMVSDTRTYPTLVLPVSGGSAGAGIPSVTYSGAARKYRRSEHFLSIALLGAQSVK